MIGNKINVMELVAGFYPAPVAPGALQWHLACGSPLLADCTSYGLDRHLAFSKVPDCTLYFIKQTSCNTGSFSV
jgi:hypothetical protein